MRSKFILTFLANTACVTFVFAQTWTAGGTTLTTTANVGIGTTAPTSKLQVQGARITLINAGEARLHLWNSQPVSEWLLGQKSTSLNNFTISTSVAGTETDCFSITPARLVGIGTISPTAKLTVSTSQEEVGRFTNTNSTNTRIIVNNSVGATNVGVGSTNPNGYIWSSTDNFFIGSDGPTPTLFVKGMNSGSVGIGTTTTGTNKLAVEGTIAARRVRVTLAPNWPDYVFNSTYKLPSLQEVEDYIQKHGHLPGVPSAKEVAKDGVDLGDSQAVLLKKIEELTLYVIELQKQVDALKTESLKIQP